MLRRDDIWFQRDLPALTAVVELLDGRRRSHVRADEVVARSGLTPDEVQHALRALKRGGLVSLEMRAWGAVAIEVIGVSPEANALAGLWPSATSVVDRLVAAIDEVAERAAPDDLDLLRRTRDHLVALPPELSAAVGAELLGRRLPG